MNNLQVKMNFATRNPLTATWIDADHLVVSNGEKIIDVFKSDGEWIARDEDGDHLNEGESIEYQIYFAIDALR